MAFREPMGFAPTAVRRVGGQTRKSKKATKSGTRRRRAAVVGGVRRTKKASSAGPAKKNPSKERSSMAKRKKARTAAQKAATRKMIAANRSRRANPARKRKASKRKPIGVRKSTKTGATSVVRKGAAKMTPQARQYTRRVGSQLSKARGKKRTTIYRTRPSGKVTKIIRENPANRTKAIVSATGGFALGIVAADVLDRYIATRKTEKGGPHYGEEAKAKIQAKADSTRIFAQAAGTGVTAIGAYMLREKSVVGTYLLGGMAAGFAAKAFGMVIKDHLMPALLKSDDDKSYGKRLGYVSGPRGYRGYMGFPRPFRGEPTVIGPRATGNVGSYGCTRVPVNPAAYFKGGNESCKPWPFEKAPGQECIEKVGRAPHGKAPSVTVPSVPGPNGNGRDAENGSNGGGTRPAPIPVRPSPPGRMPVVTPTQPVPPVRMTPQPLRPNVRLRPVGPSPIDRLRYGAGARPGVQRTVPRYDVAPKTPDYSDEPR